MRDDELFGLRRVTAVRLVRTDGRLRAEVVGVGHRSPRTMSVPLRTAARLITAGVPSVCVDAAAGRG